MILKDNELCFSKRRATLESSEFLMDVLDSTVDTVISWSLKRRILMVPS